MDVLRRLAAVWWVLVLLVVVEGYLGLCWGERTFHPMVITVGTSMVPVFHQGDVVLIRGVDQSRLAVGQVVLVRVPAADRQAYRYPPTTLHRIVSIEARDGRIRAIQTKGDNTQPDPFQTPPGDVLGTAYAKIPAVGQPVLFLRSRPGLIFLAGIVALALVYRWYSRWSVASTGLAPRESPEALLLQIRDLLRTQGRPAPGDPPEGSGDPPAPLPPRRSARH